MFLRQKKLNKKWPLKWPACLSQNPLRPSSWLKAMCNYLTSLAKDSWIVHDVCVKLFIFLIPLIDPFSPHVYEEMDLRKGSVTGGGRGLWENVLTLIWMHHGDCDMLLFVLD